MNGYAAGGRIYISLRYNASLMYPVRPCRGLFLSLVYERFPFSFRTNCSAFSGTWVFCRLFFILLRSAAFRAVLHPLFALVQLTFADVEVFEGVALRLCRRFVFKHIRADHLDERASFAVAQIGKRLTIAGQKTESACTAYPARSFCPRSCGRFPDRLK